MLDLFYVLAFPHSVILLSLQRKYRHKSQRRAGTPLGLAIVRGVVWQAMGNVFVSKGSIKLTMI